MKNEKKIDFGKSDERIVTYLEMLIAKKGLGDLPSGVISEMIMDLYPRFEKIVFLSALQEMSEEGKKKFDAFIEGDPIPERSLEFLKENVPNFSEVVKKAMDEFENIYLSKKGIIKDEF